MAVGSIENISGGPLLIKRIGWFFPTSHTESVTSESLENDIWVQAQSELETLVGANDIEIQDEYGNVVTQANVGRWLFSIEADSIPPGRPKITYTGYILGKVPTNGNLWLSHVRNLTHAEVPIHVPQAALLQSMFITTDIPDDTTVYDVQLWSDSHLVTRTAFATDIVNTVLGQYASESTQIGLPVPKGSYGIRLVRKTGPNQRSQFNSGIIYMVLET